MNVRKDFFATLAGIIIVGLLIGALAATLQKNGNPANMGVCVACFTRDIAGALGLHRAGIVQYLRPEVPAFCLGAFLAALVFREFRPRTGSAPAVRFILGMFAMIGALVFLGCPWRALLRLAGGDWNAILGLVGLIVGITIGVQFLKGGFNLGRSYPARSLAGLAMPFVMFVLLVLAALYPQFGEAGKAALFRSTKGPGAASAPVVLSILVGLVVGFLAQRTRFCTVGGIRDAILMRDFHLLSGVIAFLIAAFALNLIYGQFNAGFTLGTNEAGEVIKQPAAHTNAWLNFGGMVLAGLSFTLAGGCPGRQVFLSGEGDGDAAVFVLGMLTGAAVAHNFLMVATQPTAPYIVVIGLIVVAVIGLLGREKLSLGR
ncbi:MAG: YedE-related selenium metabolism membrane protein [Phycisphaerales bacterium]|nr:MAG: YedE-related selenium metabolism membrane protein [Phycisphaerales bacterium]